MPLIEHVYSVLIVSSSENINHSLISMLPKRDYDPVDLVHSISHARRKIAEKSYDLVIINAPLPDDFGRKFAIDISGNQRTVVVLMVKNDIYDETFANVLEYGILTIKKPTSTAIMLQAFDWMRAIHSRLEKIKKKTSTLEEKMSEIRIVNRAKWKLIDERKMTEDEAHRYIERHAMDDCMTKREIAENIINASF